MERRGEPRSFAAKRAVAQAALSFALLLAVACTRSSTDPPARAHAGGKDAGGPSARAPVELVLEHALPLDVDWDFEPSGLSWLGDHLLTVSDKHDDTIFELILEEARARVRPFIRFVPPDDEPRPFDFEGLTVAQDGSLLLASEARHRVLRVKADGNASWSTVSLQAIGAEAGLLRKRNAGLEGIALLANGRLLLAAERAPRGLLELSSPGETRGARAWAFDESAYRPAAGRSVDFSDLACAGEAVYALERNSHLVVRIERSKERWLEREAWSYAQTENDPRYAYEDQEYGLAEGLAVTKARVYIVFDNNNDRRRGTRDARPLVFVFQRPR
jgi:hypothetical protein